MGTVVSVNPPVLMVALLNVMAELPSTVPAPSKFTRPEPRVNVELLVSVPPAEMFKVPAADQDKIPLLISSGVVQLTAAVNVAVPPLLMVRDVVAVILADPLKVSVAPLLTITVAGEVIVELTAMLSLIVVAALNGGTTPPNQEAGTVQSLAPVVVM